MVKRMKFNVNGGYIDLDLQKGLIASVCYKDTQICAKQTPLFVVRLTDKAGAFCDYTSAMAKSVETNEGEHTATYSQFGEDFSVKLCFFATEKGVNVRFSVKNSTDKIVEHVEILPFVFKSLVKNGGIGKILHPYNEGVLVEDDNLRAPCHLQHIDPEYPSQGSYGMFPNMVQSQFIAYLFEGKGLYVGAHDEVRGLKAIDYYSVDEQKNMKSSP